MHPNFLVREWKGEPQGSRQWALRRVHRGRHPGKWSQKVVCDTWAHPELFCMDQILTSKPKGWTNKDSCPSPEWPLHGTRGTGQDSTAKDLKTKLTVEPAPTEAGMELRPNPHQADCVLKKIWTFCTGLKQDPESHNVIFKISGMQPKTTRHVIHQEIPRKRQSTKNNTEMTLMSE